jgi:hypothetical protein
MPRGFTWGEYVDDNGSSWAVAVDSDYVDAPERGWNHAGDSGLVSLPRGWRTRHVVGFDSGGRKQLAVAATVTCDLWTGVTNTFVIRDSEGVPQTCTVVRRVSERRIPVRADA